MYLRNFRDTDNSWDQTALIMGVPLYVHAYMHIIHSCIHTDRHVHTYIHTITAQNNGWKLIGHSSKVDTL